MLAQVTAKRIRNCFRTQCIKRELTRDEIANVNVFTTISHTYFKITKKENLLRLTN